MDLNSPVKMILPQEIREKRGLMRYLLQMPREEQPLMPILDFLKYAHLLYFLNDQVISVKYYYYPVVMMWNKLTGLESVSVKTEDGKILKPVFRTPPKDDEIVKLVYDTTAAGDFSGLENALARDHGHDSPEYAKRFERIKEIQLSFEGQAARYGWGKYCGKLHMELLLDNRTGRVLLASFGVIG